jgi:hypothetical protein
VLSRPGQFLSTLYRANFHHHWHVVKLVSKMEFFIHLLPWIRCANGGGCQALLKLQIAVGTHSPTLREMVCCSFIQEILIK